MPEIGGVPYSDEMYELMRELHASAFTLEGPNEAVVAEAETIHELHKQFPGLRVVRAVSVFDAVLARAEAEEGMALADAAARVQAWKSAANFWLRSVDAGSELSADDLVAAIGLPDEGTNRNNVVGALFSSWSKAGLIDYVGQRRSERVERHGNRQSVWRKL